MLRARVLTATVLVAGLLAALFLLARPQFEVLVAFIAGAAAYEWARLGSDVAPSRAVSYALVCVLAYFSVLHNPVLAEASLWAAAAFWVLAAPILLVRGLAGTSAGALAAAGLVVIVPAAVAMASLSAAQLLVFLGITVVADTAAYFCGRAFGRRKLAPSISPGKTWEGAVGGAVACAFYAIILTMVYPGLGARVTGVIWVPYVASAVALCALSVVGDLLESALKRRAGAKDSGNLLPGHGGILDRIDSATAVLPVGALLLQGARLT